MIRDVVLSYGWINDEMLSYMIAVSESTPGPIMINMATYVGTAQGGILGALIATFAVALPAFLIILLITALMSKVIKNKYVQAVLGGLKPCMVGIILAVGVWMIIKNVVASGFLEFDLRALILTVILAAVFFGAKKVLKKGISPILLIGISAVLGIVAYWR